MVSNYYLNTNDINANSPSSKQRYREKINLIFSLTEEWCCHVATRYFRMIVITLPTGAEPGNPADEKYQNVTRVYDDQVDGEPYITAEFEREESRTTFTVGDGKYYSRSGITDAQRKRRAIPCKSSTSRRIKYFF